MRTAVSPNQGLFGDKARNINLDITGALNAG